METAPVNAPIGLKLDKQAFLRWAESQEGRFELKDEQVVTLARSTRQHARIVGALITALSARLDANAWAICPGCFAVEIGSDIRCPDVVVERFDDDGTALSTDTPTMLVEVLSPSSVGTDMVEKLAEYTSLASLEAYIVASQEEPICWIWKRSGPERAFPPRPEEVAGRDKTIEITALGISLPMAEVFRGIGTA
jgi:Uma2 family endonuclease